jgi:hypothetical protein
MLGMVVNAVSAALLIGNIVLLVASLFLGPRLLQSYRAGVFVNAVALMLMVVPLLNLLLTNHPPAGHRAAVRILLTFTAPILIELLALLGLLRWRMRPR